MSIEMNNPVTTLEKIDIVSNLVEQMFFAHKIGNDAYFNKAHERAGFLLSEAIEELDALKSE